MLRTHYDTLKVVRDAPVEVIRAAYRALSLKYHPDRDPANPEAAEVMAQLNSAYDVLSDEQKRREYDEWIRENEAGDHIATVPHTKHPANRPRERTRPNPWSSNADKSHWRRHAALYGIGLAVIAVWGVGATVQRLRADARLETQMSSAAVSSTQSWEHSMESPAGPPKASEGKWPGFRKADPAAGPSARERRPKAARPATQPPDSLTAAPAPNKAARRQQPERASPREETEPAPPPTDRTTPPGASDDAVMSSQSEEPEAAPDRQHAYARPAVAPNGQVWPPASDYVDGYEQLNRDGLSQVVLDNSGNPSDVFLKLVSLSGATPKTVRTLYVVARDRFTVSRLTAGTYEVRYQVLDSGMRLKSPTFALEESAISGATRASAITLTLHANGDESMQVYSGGEEEFQAE